MAVLEIIHQMDVEVLMANDNIVEQECIPVGCVPPETVAVGGWSPPGTPPGLCTPWEQTTPGTMHHPPDHAPPRDHPPQDHAPPRSRPPPGPCTPPPEQTPLGADSPPVNRILDTLMKILLPCPKLRLRAVTKDVIMFEYS